MRTFEFSATVTLAPLQQAQAEAQTRAAGEAARANAEALRAQAEQLREQTRSQTENFKEQLRQQIQAEIDNATAIAEQGVPAPPVPPQPPFVFGRGDPFGHDPVIPQQAVEIVSILGMTLVFCVVGLPIARAIARWMDRRGTPVATNPDVANRLQAIEQAVESVAIEVERISEGQRFTTRVLSERTQEPAGDFLVRERDVLQVGLAADNVPGAPVNSRRS